MQKELTCCCSQGDCFGVWPAKWIAATMALISLAGMPAGAENDTEQVFKLREVSVFSLSGGDRQSYFVRGQSGECRDERVKEVKVYPAFKSKQPIFGSVRMGGSFDEEKSGVLYCYAIDESKGTAKGYDRFYFDLNHDLDLQNDKPVAPQANPPEAAKLRYTSLKAEVVFEPLQVEFDFGSEGVRKVELVPRLAISVYETKEYKNLSFVRTRAFEGDIQVGGQSYKAHLGNDYFISGRLDQPGCALILTGKDGSGRQPQWWGGDRLMALHKLDGKYWSFSASPSGDRLKVRPYSGDLGVFEIGAGKRKLDKLSVNGSLQARDRAVAVGTENPADGWPKAAQTCQLPAGDYLPSYLTIEFGRLRINVSQNYHAEGKPRDRAERPPVYAFQIRKDKPCVLDFSNPPEVMFTAPSKGRTVKPGETLQVSAVLTDPKLDIMIRGLDDTTRKQTAGADGKPLGYERNLSLDPRVIITRANGKIVAEGVMPFG